MLRGRVAMKEIEDTRAGVFSYAKSGGSRNGWSSQTRGQGISLKGLGQERSMKGGVDLGQTWYTVFYLKV